MRVGVGSLFLVVATNVVGATIELGSARSRVEFLAIGKPAAIKIRGEAGQAGTVTGTLIVAKGTFSGKALVALDNFDTGIELRNQHMKEKYLETAKHPVAELNFADVSLGGDSEAPSFQWSGTFAGVMAFHGRQGAVNGTLKLEKADGKWKADFSFPFELEDFGVETPSYLGIVVSKKVQVEASVQQ